MTGKNNLELAEAFYHSRFNDIGEFLDRGSLGRNAGAVQLFNINGITPFTEPYHAISKSIHTGNSTKTLSSFGHSERILMIKVLDKFIGNDSQDILPPSSRSRSANDRDKPDEIPRALLNNAQEYKDYLTGKNTIVKMWSELPACTYKPGNGAGEGGACSEVINKIFSENSKYGYIINRPKGLNMEQITQLTVEPLNNFKNAYIKFKLSLVEGISLLKLKSILKQVNDKEERLDLTISSTEDIELKFSTMYVHKKDKDIYDFAAEDDLEALESALSNKEISNINSQSVYGETLLIVGV